MLLVAIFAIIVSLANFVPAKELNPDLDDGCHSSAESTPVHQAHLPHGSLSGFALLTFPSLNDAEMDMDPGDINLLGNDFVFFTSFIISFLFNWVGFLLLMCFCHTIAAR